MRKNFSVKLTQADEKRLGEIVCMTDVMSIDEAASLAIRYGYQVISEKYAGSEIIMQAPDRGRTYLRHENIISPEDQAYANEQQEKALAAQKPIRPQIMKNMKLSFAEEDIEKVGHITSMTTAIHQQHAFFIALAIAHFLIDLKFNSTRSFIRKKDGSETEMPMEEVLSLPKPGPRANYSPNPQARHE